jgi:hypothetical protein
VKHRIGIRDLGAWNCSSCDPGRYQNSPGQSQCTPCAAGTAMANYAASICDSCNPGEYGPITGLLQCQSCPIGYYTSVSSQASCVACDAGLYGNSSGLSVCSSCLPGRYSTKVRGGRRPSAAAAYNLTTDIPQHLRCHSSCICFLFLLTVHELVGN